MTTKFVLRDRKELSSENEKAIAHSVPRCQVIHLRQKSGTYVADVLTKIYVSDFFKSEDDLK